MPSKICIDCGNTFNQTGPNHKRCVSCKLLYTKEYLRKYHKAHLIGCGKGGNQYGEKNPNYNGGIGIYSKIARQQYGNACMLCSATKYTCVHHKDQNRYNNDLSNLIVVCRSCHAKLHKLHENFNV